MPSADFNSLNSVDKILVTQHCIWAAITNEEMNGSSLDQNSFNWLGGEL